ncbi:MAG: bifunctional phosphopantothenoylcysteine decarboxylase/phosphopantothenate--cysteine ligase CoaBC [Nitrospiraceae bacterium]|nr:MAG: bifunctional phosphopantothenoylcysteine decarboxylase/phosphopantothenate--cysteine ligase CoaBC [Nitrospiraceae bacterium]
MLEKRNILLGVTGSIAAYRAVDLVRRLIDEGAGVRVVMTESACRFVTPYLFETISGNPVGTDLFADPFTHITLAKESHLFVIAPATANTINKISCGIADNLLSTLWLAYEGPALIAPAMNSRMYRHPTVQKNIVAMEKAGVTFVGPETGSLACGEEGEGRMADIPDIVDAALTTLASRDLADQNILITAGPTRESIDPVRFISNRSSGKMGYSLARAACRRGARVTLISGPSALRPPAGVTFVPVTTAMEMQKAVQRCLNRSTAVVMAAAVSDYAPAETAQVKLKKKDATSIKLKKTPDILKGIGRSRGKRVLVGFAAESGRGLASAKQKLKEKNCDLIVLNDISREGAGFDVDTNQVTMIDRGGRVTDYPLMQKADVADIILDRINEMKRKGK